MKSSITDSPVKSLIFNFFVPAIRYLPVVQLLLLFHLTGTVSTALAGPVNGKGTAILQSIRSGCEYDYPPYCIVTKDNKADGFSVDLLRASLQAMGYEVTFETGPWDAIKQGLSDGRFQVLPLVGRTPEREQVFDFTFPYLKMHGTILVRDLETKISEFNDLKGKSIAVLKGDNAEEFARRSKMDFSIHATATYEDALRKLAEGQYDAVIIQKLVALQLMQKLQIRNLKMVGPPLYEFEQNFCFAVKQGNKELLAILNEGLAIVIADGTFNHLHSKWFAPIEASAHDKSRIVVGGDSAFPPFEFLDENGQPAGYNVDLTRAIARQMNLDVEINLGPWREIRDGLKKNQIDIIHGMFYSSERDKQFDFSPPHTLISHVIVSRKKESVELNLESLVGKKIAVMNGDIMHELAINQGYEKQLILAKTEKDALNLLVKEKADFALIARVPGIFWANNNNWKGLHFGKKSIYSAEYCYSTTNQNAELLRQFSDGLRAIKENGEYRQIYSKWLGVYDKANISFWDIVEYSLVVIIPIFILLILSIFWSRTLKQKVEERTAELQREITERKFAEERLKYANLKLEAFWDIATLQDADARTICDHTLNSIIRMTGSKHGFFGFMNEDETIMTIHAWSGEAMKGCSMINKPFQFPVDKAGVWAEAIRQRRPLIVNDYAAEHPGKKSLPTGHVPLTNLMIVPIFSHKKIVSVAAVANRPVNYNDEDIKQVKVLVENIWAIIDRRSAEKAVYEERERLAVTLHSIGDGVITTDTKGTIVSLNRVAEELTGWQQADAIGKPLSAIFYIINDKTRQPCGNSVDKILQTGQRIELETHALLKSRDGTERLISDTGAPIKDSNNNIFGVVLVFRDMTDTIRITEISQRNQKLESLGILAGGIAHDFNNLMGGVFGYIDLAREISTQDEVKTYLSKVMATIDRARALTSQLLTFSKGGEPIVQTGYLFPFIQDTVQFASSGSNVSCLFDISQDLWACNFDKNQLGQVIDNIIINAHQAMPLGGTITVVARNNSIDNDEHPTLSVGKYVRISITDSGIGIPKDIISRIFDPFFTTKAKGHGLGLSTCHSIIRKHNGFIDVESEPGKGSTFHIYLPASESSVCNLAVTQESTHKGSGMFLVMDDEEVIRDTINDMLQSIGYTVICRDNGDDAVQFFTSALQNNQKITGVIFDLTIPGGMGGKEAVQLIRKMDPEIPVFVASGYADDPVMKAPEKYGFTGSICKPFRKSDLVKLLSRYLPVQ